MTTKRRSKRKTKVPIKFKDTVCDLTKNVDKNNDESNDDSKSEKAEVNSVNGESGDDNISLRSETNSYATEFPLLTKVNMQNKEDCNSKGLDMKIEEDDNNYVHEGKECNSPKPKFGEGTSSSKYCNNMCGDTNKSNKEKDSNSHKTFANMIKTDNDTNENKLNIVPLCVEEGREVVIFDEDLVMEGSRKWSLTLCGHFVGYKMTYYELRYNLVRMWGKYGLKEIITKNDVFLFKFRESDGMDFVLENRPWMTLPCWIKLHNVPLEAWTVNEISAVASGLGKPLIMDKTTTRMCRGGIGNFGYARVLVEIQADKEQIEIYYKNKHQRTKCSKFVKVEYSWKPPKCNECKVFGHTEKTCGSKCGNENRTESSVWDKENNQVEDGYRKVSYGNKNKQPALKMSKGLGHGNTKGIKAKTRVEYRQEKSPQSSKKYVSPWKTSKENVEELRRSANKFSILEEVQDCEDPAEQCLIEKEIWEAKWVAECLDEEDVFYEDNGISVSMTTNELDGHAYDLLKKGSNSVNLQ
ncbi:RNA-directed DNA polymerase, eukaryota, reverse transcriptase zinc-binding domain protein [Tanacetum coccineum]